MKKMVVFSCISSIILLISASFSSLASAQTTQITLPNKETTKETTKEIILQKTGITDKEVEEKISSDQWFPGFIIYQIIKGIMALVLILLILFDIIDPEGENSTTNFGF